MSYNENSDIMISEPVPAMYMPRFYDPLQSYQNSQDFEYPSQALMYGQGQGQGQRSDYPIQTPTAIQSITPDPHHPPQETHKKQKKRHVMSMFKMLLIVFIIFALLFGAGYYYDQVY